MIRRTTKIVLEILGIAVAGMAVLLGLAAWRLSSGPINLDFLTPYIEEGLISPRGDFAFDVGSLVVRWGGWSNPLSLLADDVDILRADGALLAHIPAMDLDLSLKALVRGRVAPIAVQFLGPRINVVRDEVGGLSVGMGDVGQGAASGGFSEFLAGLSASPNRESDSGYFSELRILNGDIDVEDRRNSLHWSVPAVNVTMQRDRLGLRVDLGFHINLDERTTTVNASGIYNRDLETIALGVSFNEFSPAALVEKFPELSILRQADLNLSGTLSAALDVRGRLLETGFDIESGPGFFLLTDWFPDGMVFNGIKVSGRFIDNFDRLIVDEFLADFGGPQLTVAGRVDGLKGSPFFDLGVVVRDLGLDELSYFWPQDIATGARDWVTENITVGRATEVHLNIAGAADSLAMDAVIVDDLAGSIAFENATVRYIESMPRVEDVSGVAEFTREQFIIDLESGNSSGLRLDKGHVEIFDFDNLPEKIDINLDILGPTRNALELVNHEPLRYADKMDLSPSNIGGQSAINMRLSFPLLGDLPIERIEPMVKAKLTDVSWQDVFRDLDIESGTIDLTIDDTKMVAEAKVGVYGEQAEIVWTERFQDGAERPTELQFVGMLGDQARADLALDSGLSIVGSSLAQLNYMAFADGRETLSGTVDLERTTINVPELGWFKPAGTAAQARLSAYFENGELVEVRPLVVTSSDLATTLQATFDATDGFVRTLIVNHFSYIKMDFAGRIDFAAGRPHRVEIAGKSFDASLFLDDDEDGEADESRPIDLEFSAQVDRIFVDREGTIFLDGVSANGILRDGKLAGLELSGHFDQESAALEVRISEDEKGRLLAAESNNAGATLRAVGLIDTVEGGSLEIRGRFDDSRDPVPLSATIEMRDYRIVKAPTLARILTAASFVGLLDVLSGNGIAFDNLDARVVKIADRYEIASLRAAGPGLGFTGEGNYDDESGEIEITGTIVPAYFVNSLLGNIPVVGDILVGEKGSGVFAVSYAVKGSRDDPDVSVNPLSALLPGALRNIFAISDGDVSIVDPLYPYDRELIRGK